MLQNNPVPKEALEDHLRSLVGSEGEKVANICRLIHTKSGLLSESPVCEDRDYVLKMARNIVSSHRAEQAEEQGSEPFDEEMYLGLVQNEGGGWLRFLGRFTRRAPYQAMLTGVSW